jgi:DNA-binding HxlR family transcriptional regulator
VAALQLAEVLNAFADAGFRDLWQTQLVQLDAVRAELSQQLANDSWRALACLSPGVIVDPDLDRLTLVGGQDGGLVDCQQLDVIEIIPSVWLRRRVALAHAHRRVGLALGRGPALRGEIYDERVPAMLAVLGDARRFEILRRCLEHPRTTSELASLLGITDGPVSRHLKALEHDGLIVGQRFGRYVRYAAVVEELHLLGQRLQRLPQTVWAERATEPSTMAA